MTRICGLSVLFLAALALANAPSAQAQGPYCGGGGYGGWGVNFPYGLYGSRVNDVPYFSMFPPVYYSMPVPRTYGWSPFAYPPGTMTPEVEMDSPSEIVNPYVPEKKDASPAKPTSIRTASSAGKSNRTVAANSPAPQVLINPYVKQSDAAESASTAIARK